MVIIPVEVKSRGLESRLAIAKCLVDHGIKVLIGSERSILYIIDQISSSFVYFDKSISNNKHELYRSLKAQGCVICSLDEEALSVVNNRKGYVSKRFSAENLELIDKVFFWGTIDKYPILAKYPDYSSKFMITGNPRIARPYRAKQKDFDVAFISNFTVNHASGEANFWAKLKELKRLTTLEDVQRYEGFIKEQKEKFDDFVSLIEAAINKFPSKVFVVRPHPSEDIRYWKKLAKSYHNLTVDTGLNAAVDTISKSEIMVHMGCTTGLESVLSGVGTIAYLPKGRVAKSISNLVSHKVETIEEIFELVSKPELIHSSITKLNSQLDLKSDSAKKIAYEVKALHSVVLDRDDFRIKNLSKIKLFLVKYRKYIPNNYGRMERYEFRKFPGLKSSEIRSLVTSKSVVIERKAPDVFLLKT
jgi:surface carbohydrate biosynthesis protein